MAVVYEAIDRNLDQRIAIKCPKVIFLRHLPPEARNALQVSHPNICSVYEIHTAPTNRGEVDFLSMEFLDGETLLERLRRENRLKSSNIILTTSAQGQLRASITDFGLAGQAHAAVPIDLRGRSGGYSPQRYGQADDGSAAGSIQF